MDKGQHREYCHANLAIVDISTNNDDGWIGYVSMTDRGNDAEYSCTQGCTSLTGDILSKDKTIMIDQDRVSVLTERVYYPNGQGQADVEVKIKSKKIP